MKRLAFAILVLITFSCNQTSNKESEVILDNEELMHIYKADQADRQTQPIDWKLVSKKDSLREVRIYELLDSNKLCTSLDYHNAAMIFQHGNDSIAYGMAVKLMKKSIELDSTANKWLLAAAVDRYLLSTNKPQIYGTQYLKMEDQPWKLSEIDTTKITDAERIEFGVETLAQQREKVKCMNSKKLSELFKEGQSVDELVLFIKQEELKKSKYDLSVSGINSFGYQIMNQGLKEEALKIFKLNTELYPNRCNTFDSYGECLLELDDKENAIAAYKKSLELNPKNKNAEKMLLKIEKQHKI